MAKHVWLTFGVAALALVGGPRRAAAFGLDGHFVIEAVAYERLLALPRVPETDVSGRELLGAHLMAETDDSFSPIDPRFGVPGGLVTTAYTRCVSILGAAYDGLLRDPDRVAAAVIRLARSLARAADLGAARLAVSLIHGIRSTVRREART
jgi:hypothetical protein